MKAKRTYFAAALCVAGAMLAGSGYAADDAWTGTLKNFSADQGRVLLQLSRDLYPHKELADAEYVRCLTPVDTAAGEDKAKEEWTESFKMILGASRRMGYGSYLEFVDPEERARIGKQLADGRWLRQFKSEFRTCLYTPEVKGTLKMH
jgi:hypothetical protein